MKTSIDCIPCFIRQTLDAIRMLTDDASVHEIVVRDMLTRASALDFSSPPPLMGRTIHRLIRDASGNRDPYREIKHQSNLLALNLYPGLKRTIEDAKNPFETAVRLAIAGNIIDFGAGTGVTPELVSRTVEASLTQTIDEAAVIGLHNEIRNARSILYLGDNAGEIVFDRLLIELLPVEKVLFAVRGLPIINDATREDAAEAGIAGWVPVIDNGTDVPGTVPELCSDQFREAFQAADLIVAKGQGNYETLSDTDKNIFFLFKVKCPVIARHSGHKLGDIVITRAPQENTVRSKAS